MGYTPNKQEERLTAKDVARGLLPQVRQLKETLEVDLKSLKYLRQTGDGMILRDEGQLVVVKDNLRRVEDRLRLVGGL